MTHLTAIGAATGHGQLPTIESAGQKQRLQAYGACPGPHPRESIFYSPVANFLEMPSARFHYSVIGGYAMVGLAPGLTDCHLLNPEGAIPGLRAADMWARAGEE
jgi:hypothetical protein